MILSGPMINLVSPAVENLIIQVRIQTYESTVEKIHNGEQLQKYANMIEGIKGSEDVAFFRYFPGEYEEDSCDVERIKKLKVTDARGNL